MEVKLDFVERVKNMDRDTIVSGQLFFRFQGPSMELDMSHRTIVGVCGIIALPNSCLIKDEHQYPIAGFEHGESKELLLGIGTTEGIDLKEQARGMNIGALLTRPIWKI